MNLGPATRFAGITREVWLGMLVMLCFADLLVGGLALVKVGQAAQEARQAAQRAAVLGRQGAQAHAAECSYKADRQHALQQSEQFILLSPEQRIKKYGRALGNIPVATIRNTIANETEVLKSLSSLRC